MTVYSTSALSASITWPEPIEPIWQVLPKYSQSLPGWKRTDLGLCERLFIGAVLNIPKERRPWGIVSWLAETSVPVFDRGVDKSRVAATTRFVDDHSAKPFRRKEDRRGHVKPNEANSLDAVAARRSIRPFS